MDFVTVYLVHSMGTSTANSFLTLLLTLLLKPFMDSCIMSSYALFYHCCQLSLNTRVTFPSKKNRFNLYPQLKNFYEVMIPKIIINIRKGVNFNILVNCDTDCELVGWRLNIFLILSLLNSVEDNHENLKGLNF